MKTFSIKHPFISLRKPLAMVLAVLSFFTPVHAADVEKKSDEYLSAESNHKALDFISDYATELIVGTCVAVAAASLLAWRFFPRSSGSIGAGGDDDAKSTPLPAELDKLVLAKNLVEGSPLYDAAVESIKADLKRRQSIVLSACTAFGWYEAKKGERQKFDSVWEALKYLLASDAVIKYVEDNYSEWKIRLSPGGEYNYWVQNRYKCGHYQCMQLMSIAYLLRLAALVNYHPVDSGNVRVFKEKDLKAPDDLKSLDTCEDSNSIKKERLKKVIVEDNDILRSAHRFLLNNPEYCKNGAIGVLNAGDRRLTSGFIPGWGCALEEYLATMTTLLSDISYKAVIAGQSESDDSVFYNRGFEAVCGFKDGRLTSDELLERARKYLTGKIMPKDFYDVLVSRNVRLIRGLGDVGIQCYYQEDESFPFNNPTNKDYISYFSPSKDGLGSISFPVVSVGGLEDRFSQNNGRRLDGALKQHGDKLLDESKPELGTIRDKWKEITKRQCELVLRAFIQEGVKVPFLCAFGAGAFGGDAQLVAECWREVLITEGYINYFDKVVFPIGYDQNNYTSFMREFCK